MLKTDVAKGLRAVIAKDSPTANQVHVNAPLGTGVPPKGKKKKPKRPALYKAIAKSNGDATGEKAGTYIGRLVQNADALASWWDAQRVDGEPDALDDNAHVTVAYSRTEFPWSDDPNSIILDPSCYVGIKVLGPDRAVVLRLNVPLLESRWKDTMACGATWDHDGYEPHVTLFYLGADAAAEPRDGMALPTFPIVLGPELSGPRGADIFAPDAPDWYVAPA